MNKDFLKQLKVVILLFVLLDGAIGFGVYKVEKMIQAKDQEIKNYLQELERKSRGSQNLKEALARVRSTKVTMSNYERFLFRSGNELDLITDLENIASKNNVTQKIESSNLDKINDNTITLNLRTSGSYKNILGYLADLENYDYFLQVTSLDFNPIYDLKNPENSSGAVTDLRVNLKLYVNP